MEKTEVTIESPVVVAGLTVIPVVQILKCLWHRENSTSVFAAKRPIAVVMVSPSAKKAFRVTGEEFSIDQLVKEFPVIKEALDKF